MQVLPSPGRNELRRDQSGMLLWSMADTDNLREAVEYRGYSEIFPSCRENAGAEPAVAGDVTPCMLKKLEGSCRCGAVNADCGPNRRTSCKANW